ncbi:DUF2339 domain-containing protein [Actinomyces sp.]|uniref:DUF2339 domain-containing protein n=1 Tax=Actinomyces sp. TaxID=29317 RepID=UPI0026DD0D04|nr:DUF2339 domain-containing protein [Actinomyces sp.]MDO4900252.1 DUF2339 domain-containing protein [Actinomyces sp.]
MAVIGAALIAGLAPVAALGLMVAWAFVLLLVSCVTAQFFTAVISMLGALVTGVVLATGAACIVIGFRLRATTLRHYGLTLVLLVVFKLAVVDLAGQNSLTRILALMVAGVVCFGLSLAYNHFAQEQAEHGAIGDDSAGAISPAGRGGSSYPR